MNLQIYPEIFMDFQTCVPYNKSGMKNVKKKKKNIVSSNKYNKYSPS